MKKHMTRNIILMLVLDVILYIEIVDGTNHNYNDDLENNDPRVSYNTRSAQDPAPPPPHRQPPRVWQMFSVS